MNKRRSRTEWQALIEEPAVSGLTQKSFCGQRGIPLVTFGYWKRKFRAESSYMPTDFDTGTVSPSLADWIELPTQGSATDEGWEIELELGNDLCLRLRQC